jgi:hypothetical protein
MSSCYVLEKGRTVGSSEELTDTGLDRVGSNQVCSSYTKSETEVSYNSSHKRKLGRKVARKQQKKASYSSLARSSMIEARKK